MYELQLQFQNCRGKALPGARRKPAVTMTATPKIALAIRPLGRETNQYADHMGLAGRRVLTPGWMEPSSIANDILDNSHG